MLPREAKYMPWLFCLR